MVFQKKILNNPRQLVTLSFENNLTKPTKINLSDT